MEFIKDILLGGFIFGLGLLSFLIYFTIRCFKSGGFDKSNLHNPVRVISFLATHANIIPHLLNTLEPDDAPIRKRFVFWYVGYDENKEVVQTVGEPDFQNPAFKKNDNLDMGKF